MIANPKGITMQEAATLKKCSVFTIRYNVVRGKLTTTPLTKGRRFVVGVTLSSLAKWEPIETGLRCAQKTPE